MGERTYRLLAAATTFDRLPSHGGIEVVIPTGSFTVLRSFQPDEETLSGPRIAAVRTT
ncbi:MAG: hypothetical protein HYX27_10670 [Acidobacteria bacterium]|nr:hypothetical protein [Acidobacteriota bacterium]